MNLKDNRTDTSTVRKVMGLDVESLQALARDNNVELTTEQAILVLDKLSGELNDEALCAVTGGNGLEISDWDKIKDLTEGVQGYIKRF